jgi:hypothetical protein
VFGNGLAGMVQTESSCALGQGGFGSLSILLPAGETKPLADLPGEVRFITDFSDKKRLGEEITLATLDQVTYEPDYWR